MILRIKKLLIFMLFVVFLFQFEGQACFGLTSKKKNLFFEQYYKMPTVMAIALNHPEDENDILTNSRNNEYIEKLKKVFNHVYLRHNQNDYNEFLSKKNSYNRVFSCNWYHGFIPENFNENKKYYHFEDGSREYDRDSAFDWLCKRENVKKMFLFFPKYRFNSFQNIQTESISREKYLKALDILYGSNSIDSKIFFCMNCPEQPNIMATKQIINVLKEYNNVAIKCHPRDGKKYLWANNFKIIDKNRPFESFYKDFKGIVISDVSSSLHTAKFMQPESTVICTYFIPGNKHSLNFINYTKMLKELGVLFPKTIEELREMISQNINKN